MISDQALTQFKRLCNDEFGIEMQDKEAMEKATSLLTLFDAIYKPVKKDWLGEKGHINSSVND